MSKRTDLSKVMVTYVDDQGDKYQQSVLDIIQNGTMIDPGEGNDLDRAYVEVGVGESNTPLVDARYKTHTWQHVMTTENAYALGLRLAPAPYGNVYEGSGTLKYVEHLIRDEHPLADEAFSRLFISERESDAAIGVPTTRTQIGVLLNDEWMGVPQGTLIMSLFEDGEEQIYADVTGE